MTTKEAKIRVKQQAKLTGMPEDPLLLRVYQHETLEPRDVEKVMHRLLDAADHDRSASNTGGKEWFVTSPGFLDTIADVLGLSVTDVDEAAPANADGLASPPSSTGGLG